MTFISHRVARVLSGEDPTRALEESFDTIERLEPSLGCLISFDRESAFEQLARLKERIANNEKLPLAGLAVILKDNICVAGGKTTCASRMLESYVSPYDSTVWSRLAAAGAVLVGKANMDEFAMGSSTENSAFGPTRNPFDLKRVPGGSSGGSAAAVAAGYAPASLGSDTGGSIRQPAAFCGVTGLKPSYGLVSRYGLVAYASSLDQIGPLTRSAVDSALILSVIGGHDPLDATSSIAALPAELADLEKAPSNTKVRLAVPDVVTNLLNGEARLSFEKSISELKDLGVSIDEVELPYLEEGLSAYYLIAASEASSNLARYDGVRYGSTLKGESYDSVSELTTKVRSAFFGKEVKRRIMLGTYALSAGYYDAYYHRAQKIRTAMRLAYDEIFAEGYLAVLTPTAPGPAFALGEKTSDPLSMYLSDVFTVAANMTGLPAISIPSGSSPQGLPLGIQMQGRAFSELELLTLARDYQLVTQHHLRAPTACLDLEPR